jgi:hypothetical protein
MPARRGHAVAKGKQWQWEIEKSAPDTSRSIAPIAIVRFWRTVRAAPPPMRFSDPLESRKVLEAIGFTETRVERVDTAWTAQQPARLIDLVYGGAVRARWCLKHSR